jgi:molecular chaperone DnaK (HSP70)
MAFYGVDLGTTFCAAGVARRGVVTRVGLERAGTVLASTVLLDDRDPVAPRAALGRAAVDRWRDLNARGATPEGVVLVRGSKNHVAAGHAPLSVAPWRLGGMQLRATDIAALLLRGVAARVAADPTLPALDAVVVTHPQRFRNRERRATAQAAHLAGLRCAALMPEPDAAAWAYGLGQRFDVRDGTFAVFDFGGGTLDVTVMRRGETGGVRSLDAVASYGVQVGGMGVDELVRERLLARYAERVGEPGLGLERLSEGSREALLAAAEGIKIQLNAHATGDPNPLARKASRTLVVERDDGIRYPAASVSVTLGEFSQWIGEVVSRAVDCADEALGLASLGWDAVDELFLVGGSSWLHPVQTALAQRAGGRVRIFDDADSPLNPAMAVASGAALYAAHCEGVDAQAAVAWRGVTPDAFGVRAREADPHRAGERRETLAVLVPARTSVPFEGRRTFRKRGGARVLPVEVLEGRSLADATPLGRFELRLDADLPDGAPVDVTLRVGRDGVLSLAVREPTTGETQEVTLAATEGLYADDEMDARRTMLAGVALDIDP